MTTIIVDQDVDLAQNKFKSIFELYTYLEEEYMDKNLGKIMEASSSNDFVDEKVINKLLDEKIG